MHTNAHTIDFVLVYRPKPTTTTTTITNITTTSTATTTTTVNNLEEDHEEEKKDLWRKNFEEELQLEGLILEEDYVEDLPLR